MGPREGRRSPWVRAFCDLYHPAGPWGRFCNAPDISSKAKYRFKSYKLAKIYEYLKKKVVLGANDAVYMDLYEALHSYYTSAQYYDEFLAACGPIAAAEAKKSVNQRSPIPTGVVTAGGATNLVVAAGGTAGNRDDSVATAATDETTAASIVATISPAKDTATVEVAETVTLSSKGTKRTREPSASSKDPPAANTRRRRCQQEKEASLEAEDGNKTEKVASDAEDDNGSSSTSKSEPFDTAQEFDSTEETEEEEIHDRDDPKDDATSSDEPKDGSSTAPVLTVETTLTDTTMQEASETPSMARRVSLNNNAKKEEIETKRAKLAQLLKLRKADGKQDIDAICVKIQKQIDAEDEKLLELIMLE